MLCATRAGDHYVLNGRKTFISLGPQAKLLLVNARTGKSAGPLEGTSTFLVPGDTPGFTLARIHDKVGFRMHLQGEVAFDNVKVPAENLLGGEGNGFNMGQHRLAYGRLRHGMHNVSMAQRALDLAVAHVTSRETFGKKLSERQGVQFMLADCAQDIYIARLMLLHIAYKAEKGMDLRQENGIAKVYLANMVHRVVDTAIQLHGALGYSMDTPLARWYTHIRSQRLVDGPDEVHRWTTGRNVIKAFERDGTTAAAVGGDLL
jgi:acyl-CoA dehydrogenase